MSIDPRTIKQDDLFDSANATAERQFPEVTEEVIRYLYEKKAFDENDAGTATSIASLKIPSSRALQKRIRETLGISVKEFVMNLKVKVLSRGLPKLE